MEAENPRMNLPKAARKVGKRIVFYYVAAAIALSLNLSANDPILVAAFQDPDVKYGGAFVLMLRRWGLPRLAYVVNGVGLIAAFGVANVFLYVAVTPDCF
jgi:amino acid permease